MSVACTREGVVVHISDWSLWLGTAMLENECVCLETAALLKWILVHKTVQPLCIENVSTGAQVSHRTMSV